MVARNHLQSLAMPRFVAADSNGHEANHDPNEPRGALRLGSRLLAIQASGDATMTSSVAAAGEKPSRERILAGNPPLRHLVASDGTTWAEFCSSMRPRYGLVWRDIALIFGCLLGGLALHFWLSASLGNWIGLAFSPVFAIWLGYWLAALACFTHEAAHHNLHSDRRWNDRLANQLICPWILEEITHYRALHWQHHLHLGSPDDTEISYRNAPGVRFVFELLFGIQLFGALRRWHAAGTVPTVAVKGSPWPRLRGVALHVGVVLMALWLGLWSSALTWVATVVVVFPFCGSVRQLLEHRPLADDVHIGSDPEISATNRVFPVDFFSRFFGAAGFNRHLLHHWYPQASYSCFDDFEAFLLKTELRSLVEGARAEYPATWRALVHVGRSGRRGDDA
jgi:fatty acid desaturase